MNSSQNTKSTRNRSFASKLLFTVFLLFMLCSATALAYENYQLTAPFSPVTVASCAASTEVLVIKNAGDEAAQITLTFVDKDVNKFAQIVPSQLFLTPGETKTLTIFINAPCTTQGTFDYAIQAQGNGIKQIFDRQISINKISNVDFIATNGNVLNSCPCVPQTIPFTITNTGSWAESYTVSQIGHEENVAVPQGQIFLAPGQTFSGAAFVSFSCQTYGTKDFKLQVEATNSQFKATMPVTYNIAACYDYTLGIDKQVTVCEQDRVDGVAVINNTAAYTNTFDLDASLPVFAELVGNQVTLNPQQVGIAPIKFEPSRGDAGVYTYTIDAASRLGKLVASQTGNLNVQRCYEYNIATPQDKTKYDVCAPGEQLSFTITNNGELTQEMHVNSTDARFTSTPKVFNLSAGASKNITLSVPSNGIEKKMNFELQVWAKNNPNVIATKRITLQPYDLQTCFGVEVAPDTFVINNSAQNLSIKVTNQGIRGAVYNVTVAGPQWAKLLNNTVYIAAKSSQYVTLHTNAPVFVDNGTFVVNMSLETAYTQQVEKIKLILNPQTAKWLLWFMIILLLLLIALLIILLVARRSRSISSRGQPAQATATATPVAQKKIIKAPAAPKKLTAAQKRALRNERARNRRNAKNVAGWGRLLFIILIVAILLALLLMLILKDSNPNNNAVTNTTNGSNTSVSNTSITGGPTGTIQTNVTIKPVTNSTNQSTNQTQTNQTTQTNQSVGAPSKSFWQMLSDLFGNFRIFGADGNATLSNVTASNASTIVNATANTTTNQTTVNVTQPVVTNVTTNVTQNTTNTTVVDEKAAQRTRDLDAAYTLLADAQAKQSNRVFVLAQNTTGTLNLSNYFVDLDNLSLSFEFQSVNATKMTALINDDLLTLRPYTNFVGVQTFRIVATNRANLSTTSPLFTIAVLDEMPSGPISKSVQIGLLILLIVIAFIVYFDIRLISKQYEHARSMQNDKKRK